MTLATCSQCGSHVIRGDACPQCGTPTPSPSPDLPRYSSEAEVILEKLRGAVAPKYQVRRILGYGGMAGVYLADEPRLGRQIAIKVMSPSLMADPKLVDRFGQEARTIAQLSHPNIVTIYDVDDREDLHYFTMTYVGGRTLGQLLSESIDVLPIDVILAWFYQIGDALSYAHQHGIVHRDVKPGNVLLDVRGNALVTDFGIAKVTAADSGLTRTGLLVGTPAYMSPEQCQSARVTGSSDQYSLGAVLYQMVTGQRPFAGDTMTVIQAHVFKQPTPVLELRPDCPNTLARSIERMLQKRPEERWPTLSAAIAASGASPPGLDGALRDRLEQLAVQAATLEISSWRGTLREGVRERISVRARDATGHELSNRRVEWRPDHPAVICVVPENLLLATAPGHTTIEATCGNASATVEISVEADPVRDIEVVARRRSLSINEHLSVEAIVHDFDGTRLDDRAVLWSSSDPEIATVDGEGVVVGVRAGEFVLTASTGGKFAAVPVTVTPDVMDVSPPRAQAQRAGERADGVVAPQPALPSTEPARIAAVVRSAPGDVDTPSAARRPIRRWAVAAAAVLVLVPAAFVLRSLGGRDERTPSAKNDSTATVSGRQASTPVQVPAPAVDTVTRAPAATRPADSVRQPAVTSPRLQRETKRPSPPSSRAAAASTNRPSDSAARAAPPPTPLPASLDIRGELPAGATIAVVDASGQTRTVSGRSIQLAAGNYVVQFSAPGYENDRQAFRLAAGESQSWTPSVREVARPRTVATPPTTTAPVHDRGADVNAIEGAIRGFVAALDRRDARTVLPLLPSEGRDGWQVMLESRDVRDFHARLDRVSPASIDGDAALVDFRVHVSYRNFNESIQRDLEFKATTARDGSGWRLSFLQPKS